MALPPPLAGLGLFEIDVTWLVPGRSVPVGVVHDRRGHTVTAVLRVHGDGQFSLLDVLGSGCAPRRVGGGVGRVRP